MASNSAKLLRARLAKNDEFYTQYADVESECDHYRPHFFNKRIYCNCDTGDSAFVKYFNNLKSQGLIRDVWHTGGLGGADFRSPQSIELLQKADLVITNPPFSLFREYMSLILKYNKPFLVICNKNAIAYRELFELIKTNKIWPGVRRWAGGMRFIVPDSDQTREVPAIWLTNLDHACKPEPLHLSCHYTPESFPEYDNASAINIDKTASIPCDYSGIMGVPITFIEKYCPAQFEILGLDKDFTTDGGAGIVNGHRIYSRIFIRKRLDTTT